MSTNIGSKLSKVAGTISTAGDVLSWVNVGLNSYEAGSEAIRDYCTVIANLEILEENIYILDTIVATTDNTYLKSAAKNIRYYALNVRDSRLAEMSMKLDYTNSVISSVSLDILHTTFSTFPELALAVPYIGPVIVALEATREFGNAFFGVDKMSKAAALTVATAQTADALSIHYVNHLKGGDAIDGGSIWVAYSDYSEEIYVYLLNLIEIRKFSEVNMMQDDFQQPDEIKQHCQTNISYCESTLLTKYNNKLFVYYCNVG